MNNGSQSATQMPPQTGRQSASDRLGRAAGILAGRLARLLDEISGAAKDSLAQSRFFLTAAYEAATPDQYRDGHEPIFTPRRTDEDHHPIDRLVEHFNLPDKAIELLLLAAMPDEHEGYSAVLRSLHPRGEPRATAGLAAQLLFADSGGRNACRAAIEGGTITRAGILHVTGDSPFFDRTLMPADALWPALHEIDTWPPDMTPLEIAGDSRGIESWLSDTAAQRAVKALSRNENCTISVQGDDPDAALHRAVALVRQAGRRPVAVSAPPSANTGWQRLMYIHSVVRHAVPILRTAPPSGPVSEDSLVSFTHGAVVVAGSEGPGNLSSGRSLIAVPLRPLTLPDRRRAWATLVPELAGSANRLAALYPIEPYRIAETAEDLKVVESTESRPLMLADVAESLRSRNRRKLAAGVKLIHPKASWDDLVLPRHLITQLHEAVDRLLHQSRVLDDWGFLRNRTGARGVRLLFAGPPGTGKTLSAEVLAHALDADLLVVDVAHVVSKWIGETEKNLSAIFDAAESYQAVLLFDEADALFAKRTEVADAHDRYANLETAYLLQRLERFEGMAILATNFRQNIDAAFIRRLEFVLDFSEPDRDQRISLWQRHVPAGVHLDPEVKWHELAALYSLVGGVIRNAAVAAAFRAAAQDQPLGREHFIHAIRREYEKAGKSFPGLPGDMKN